MAYIQGEGRSQGSLFPIVLDDLIPADHMRENLKEGVRFVSAPQLFPTPPHLVARMVEIAQIEPGHRVLEPSAGTGVLCKAITATLPTARVFAVEINPQLCKLLSQTINPPEDDAEGICKNVLEGDFLEVDGLGNHWDRIVMNPPFADGADIKHISHALKHLKPGGGLVAICANGHARTKSCAPSWRLTVEFGRSSPPTLS
jgi:methylase of polypeptide subunit release factors